VFWVCDGFTVKIKSLAKQVSPSLATLQLYGESR
jgi:hypothetical protein